MLGREPTATLEEMMKKHLSTTTDEVVTRLTKNWDTDVRAFDAVYDHILHMSDALSEGIIKQFPRSSQRCRPQENSREGARCCVLGERCLVRTQHEGHAAPST